MRSRTHTAAAQRIRALYEGGMKNPEEIRKETGYSYGTIRQYLVPIREDLGEAKERQYRTSNVRGQIPADAPMKQRVAFAFVKAAQAILKRRKQPHTVKALAPIIGATPAFISSCLTGRQGSIDTVNRWLLAWNEAGYPRLVLGLDGDRFELREAS